MTFWGSSKKLPKTHQSITPSTWILDEKERSKIERKRILLQERAKRIHQTRQSSIGVDKDGLDSTVLERKHLQNEEKKLEENYEKLMSNYDRMAIENSDKKKEETLQSMVELERFWKKQTLDKMRNRNMEDEKLKKEKAYNLRFLGEDEGKKEREMEQKKQLQSVLQDQIMENELKEAQKLQTEKIEENVRKRMESEAIKLHKWLEQCQLAKNEGILEFNKRLNDQRKRDSDLFQQLENTEIKNHIEHCVSSTLLTENRDAARSIWGPHRVLCDRWKGLTSEQREENTKQLLHQIEETKRQKMELERLNKAWNECMATTDAKALEIAHKEEEEKRNAQKEQIRANAILADNQRKQHHIDDNIINRNVITDEFFNKFGVYPR